MYGELDISVSGMIAQRTRLNTIAANIANQNTIYDSNGQPKPFARRMAMIAEGNPGAISPDGKTMGVHVASIEESQSPGRPVYDPDHNAADENGYVWYPDIDPVTEQIAAMEAVRAYEANVAAAEATKALVAQALRMIA